MKRYMPGRLFLGCMLWVCCSAGSFAQREKISGLEAVLHYTISAQITFTSSWILTCKHPDMTIKNKYLISGGIGLFAGVSKEVIDVLTGEYFSFIDLGFDLLGIGSGLLLHYLIIDKDNLRSSISLNVSDRSCQATIKFCF